MDGLEGLVGARFWRKEPRAHAISYAKGLLSDGPTRNGWTIAEQAGHQTPDKIQKMLNRGSWDQDGVREEVRSYVVANVGDPGGVLVFDETGDIKQGTDTVAVARPYTGVTGQVENCQVAVFAAYVSTHGQPWTRPTAPPDGAAACSSAAFLAVARARVPANTTAWPTA